MKALVVFDGTTERSLSKLLKSGFKHCFCALLDEGGYWLVFDGIDNRTYTRVVAGADFDLAAFYASKGYRVVETVRREQALRAPFIAANCVGMVKAMLHLRSLAVTPYGLYKHLTRRTG